ncbi:MAG: hypothetical protein MRJ65_00990 [Candidatus Brocadiaceae bacterium]|nr:hypothetical protein [Candidatus Brocadiaceae bacterium]
MNFARVIQIIGIIIVLDALYFGIVKDSMKMEVILLFAGSMVFYTGRMFEKKNK